MEAKTYAILGRPEPCHRALGLAETQLARGSDNDPAWIAYFDEAQFAGVAGSCYRDLAALDAGHALKAEAPIQRAMRSRSKEQIRNRALDRINLAIARLRRRELDGMCIEANLALDLASSLKSHRVDSRLRSLAKQAEPIRGDHLGASAVCERIGLLPDLV
jgi:hypothetical protein